MGYCQMTLRLRDTAKGRNEQGCAEHDTIDKILTFIYYYVL